MESNVYFLTTVVEGEGHEDEYVNLPVIQDNYAVGLVQEAKKVESGFELKLAMWGKIDVGFIKYIGGEKDIIKPSHISFNNRVGGNKNGV